MPDLPERPDDIALTGNCQFSSSKDPNFYQNNLSLIASYMTLVNSHLKPIVYATGIQFESSLPLIRLSRLWHSTIEDYFESSDKDFNDLPKTYTSHKLIKIMRDSGAEIKFNYTITNYSKYELINQTLVLRPAKKNDYLVAKSYRTNKHLYSEYTILKYFDFNPDIGLVTRTSRLNNETSTIINDKIAHKLHVIMHDEEGITGLKDQDILRGLLNYFNHNIHYKGAIIERGHYDNLQNLRHWYYSELYKPLRGYIDQDTQSYRLKAWRTQQGGTKYAFKAYSYADLNNTFNINKQR